MASWVDSGFAVLRTPLLAVDPFGDWTRRMRDAAAAGALDGGAGAAPVTAWMRDTLADPLFREAVRVASPALSSEVDAWLTGARAVDEERLVHSVARYFSRAAFRPTPFGLFAGCSVVAVAERTRLELGPRAACTRRSRIDMDHLAELARVLAADPECRRRVPLRTNTSVAQVGGRLHYVETRYAGRTREHVLTAADPTPEILDALARGRHGTSFGELATPLLAQGYAADEVEAFIGELLDSQLLVPELDPLVSGGDAAAELASTLEAAGCAPRVSAALREVVGRLRAIDRGGAGGAPGYDAALAPLRSLDVEVDDARLLQVDLYKPAPAASLGRQVVDDAAAMVELLAGIAPRQDPLATFAARFEARYETREVPLLEALDEEVGIGMPAANADDGVARRRADALAQREGALAELRCRAACARAAEVELTDDDVQRLRWPGPRALPDALAFFGTLVAAGGEAVDRGDYRLVLSYASGPSGARLLGRFAHLDPALEQGVRAHVAAEEALRPDAVFAEIIHLPQGRIGNVIARPSLRAYELPYLGRGSAPPGRQLELDDLWVSVERGRVRLRSARLGREVHPRLSTAHNYAGQRELPLYRFLCSLQDHAQPGSLHWSWGAQEAAPFLPRVTRGRLVLSRARWKLSPAEIQRLSEAEARGDAGAVQAWRRERDIPALALLADGDNRLPVDFDNPVSTLVFARLLRGRGSAVLTEAFAGPDALCVRGPEGSFTNEIVVPLVRRVPAERPAGAEARRARPAPHAVPRAYPPGSEWLYARLYCGRGSAEQVLREVVAPVVAAVRAELPSAGWFFLRYADPEFHLRVRFRAGRENAPRVMQLLGEAAAPAVASGRVSRLVYDTYHPEVERYGGPHAIAVAEAVFGADSDAALWLVTARDAAHGLHAVPRELAVLAGIDRMFADAGLNLDERSALLEHAMGEVPAAVRRARSLEYRPLRSAIESLLAAGGDDPGSRAVRSLLAARSAGMRPLLMRLRALDEGGLLEAPLKDVLVSLSHMWVNRALADGRTIEPLLYDRLHRAYRGLAGRARAQGGAPAARG